MNFTISEFLDMMARYNNHYRLMLPINYSLCIMAILALLRKTEYSSRIVTSVLAVLWLWTGVVFNGLVFSEISPRAVIFAAVFVVESMLLVFYGFYKSELIFRVRADLIGAVGWASILYGLLGYPLIASLLGRGYPQSLVVGLAPCPTVVFTLGLLFWSERRLTKAILVIPLFYALVGGAMVSSKGIVEDLGMIIIAMAMIGVVIYRDRIQV